MQATYFYLSDPTAKYSLRDYNKWYISVWKKWLRPYDSVPEFDGWLITNFPDNWFFCMIKAITADALVDNEEYEEILEDMREECSKYGMHEHGIVNLLYSCC